MARQAEVTVELVLRAVEQVPPGKVVSYGDIAELVGTSARRVGAVMATQGGEVSWWRVTNRDGVLPSHLLPLARKHWAREGVSADASGCNIARHRADLMQLACAYADAAAELIG
ncbi:MGMT family protein [Tessaracoccus lubricantis]|uniref:MGMT family protein n=1 Tax=Tessaracoccus lubricantis TaxID=545543 RepID=A0ABP9F8R1_9ACTN